MATSAPLDRTTLLVPPSRSHVAAYRRLRREQGRAARTAGRLAALWVLGLLAVGFVALLPAAIVVAATTDDPDRRASASVAAGVVALVLLVVALGAVLGRSASAGPALLAVAERNGLALTAWARRDVEAAGSLVVHVAQHDADVLRDHDGTAWGRTSIHVGGGRRIGDGSGGGRLGMTPLAFVDVPLGAPVPHMLLADARAEGPSSLAPDAIGAVELAPATPMPWRVWTTEHDADQAASMVDAALLATLERHAPDMDVELVGDRALLTRRVDRRWRGDDDAWLDVVDGIRIHVAPALRAAAARARSTAWAPLPHDEPLGRSMRLELVRRARRDAWADGALDVVGGAAS